MANRIELDELQRLIGGGAQIVEVLPEAEYAQAHLPGAISIPIKVLNAETAAGLDRSAPVVVYCWDYLCDMSPRAARRLDTLGFTEVYDYVPGKVDWRAHGLPVEGEFADVPTAGGLARDDIVTCGLADSVGAVREQVGASAYSFALITTDDHILLGRLRGSVVRDAPAEATAEAVMEPGPSTVRADTLARDLAERLAKRDLKTAIVSTPEGRLIGVVWRSDLEAAG